MAVVADNQDLRIRDPIVTCGNRHCLHEHRVHQRRLDEGAEHTRCPRCGDEWFREQVPHRTAQGAR
jgi:hypothetical protein